MGNERTLTKVNKILICKCYQQELKVLGPPYTCLNFFFLMRHLSAWLLGTWGKKNSKYKKTYVLQCRVCTKQNIQWIIFWTFVVRMHNWAYMKHSNSQPVDRIYVIVLSTIITAVILQPAPAVPAEWNSTGSAPKFRPPVVFVSCTRFSTGIFSQSSKWKSLLFPTIEADSEIKKLPFDMTWEYDPSFLLFLPCTPPSTWGSGLWNDTGAQGQRIV